MLIKLEKQKTFDLSILTRWIRALEIGDTRCPCNLFSVKDDSTLCPSNNNCINCKRAEAWAYVSHLVGMTKKEIQKLIKVLKWQEEKKARRLEKEAKKH